MKVMIVDDDKFQIETVTAWLESAGFEVVSRSSPFGTSRDIMRERPDLLLLDINMPGLAGTALVGALSKHIDSVGIIFYSGEDWESLERLALQYQVLGAIKKTPSPREFLGHFKSLSVKWQARSQGAPTRD